MREGRPDSDRPGCDGVNPKVEIYQTADGWRWRLLAADGETLATSGEYGNEVEAERALKRTASAMYTATDKLKRGSAS